MRGKELLDKMELADARYIEAAAAPVRRKKRIWAKWGAMAACLCLAAAALFGARYYRAEHRFPVLEEPAGYSQQEATAEIPRWEDMTVYEQYYEIALDGHVYTARRGVVPPERIGEKLGDVTAQGRDEYAEIAGEDGRRYLAAEVYAITGVSSGYAVAVRYAGTEAYYSALDSYARPDTLGQFIDDLALESEASFGSVWYEYRKPSGEFANIRFDGVSGERIWTLLLASPGAENVYDDLDFDFAPSHKTILSISVDIPLFGYENISVSVHEGGYLETNILDTGKRFYVGEENTQAFVDYVLSECEGHEIVYTEGESVPE